jgi:hypothetical protein
MLRLNLTTAPFWIEGLPAGVRIEVRPVTSVLVQRAIRRAAQGLSPEPGAPVDADDLEVRIVIALAEEAVIGWEGVADADGQPLAVTPEAVAALLALYPVYRTFRVAYVDPALTLAAEGNVLTPSPGGTGAAGGTTAVPAAEPAPSARLS